MKYCPECGYPLENVEICKCGYNKTTGKVDQEIRNKQIEENKRLRDMSNDNIVGEHIFIDEIPKNINNNQNGLLLIAGIKNLVINYITGMNQTDIEKELYNFYKNNNLDKVEYLKVLKEINDLQLEKHLNNVMKKIISEE